MGLKKHYAEFHAVDEDNYFFKKFFARDRAFCLKQYLRCQEFLSDGRE